MAPGPRTTTADGGRPPDGGAPAACAPATAGADQAPAANPLTAQEGTRLKLRFTRAANGTRAPVGWYDSELGTDCSFQDVGDGTLRCLPAQTWTSAFEDLGCGLPVYIHRSSSCSAVPTFVAREESMGSCEIRVRVHRLAERTGAATLFEGGWEQLCRPTNASRSAVDTTYRVGAELLPDRFVKAEKMAVPADSCATLETVGYLAEDGAVLPHVGWQGAGSKRPCIALRLTDNEVHCVPLVTGGVSTTHFVDPACTVPALVRPIDPCDPPAPSVATESMVVVQESITGSCPPASRLRPVETRLVTAYYKSSSASGCTIEDVSKKKDYAYYSSGDPLPPSRFPTVGTSHEPATDGRRLRRSYVRGGGSAPAEEMGSSSWFDSMLNEPCFPLRLGDKHRCVPGHDSSIDFTDPQCTAPVLRSNGCPRKVAVLQQGRICGGNRVFAVGAKFSGPTFTADTTTDDAGVTTTACKMYEPSAGTLHYSLTPMPPETFAELTFEEPTRGGGR